MLQPRLRCPSTAIDSPLACLAASLNALSLCPKHARLAPAIFLRHASHATQGRANGPGDSAGRRLGAKKTASQFVIPGNIIFRQRGKATGVVMPQCFNHFNGTKDTFTGTKWHPGENVGIGKDHTIFATETGYVRYYQDPARHPKRRYIGVALEREGKLSVLPTPQNAPTRRRLGMYATPMKGGDTSSAFLESHLSANSTGTAGTEGAATPPLQQTANKAVPPVQAAPVMRQGTHMQREANFEIGRAAEKKGITVREYDRGDRWLAWRKRAAKVKKAALARAAKASRKGKGKKANKGAAGGPGRRR